MIDQDHSNNVMKNSQFKYGEMLEYLIEYDDRPTNLDLWPCHKGKGCLISENVHGLSPTGMIYEKSKLVAINDLTVENQKFENIKMLLKTAALPLQLLLHSPNLESKRREKPAKQRQRHNRSRSKPAAELKTRKGQTSGRHMASARNPRKEHHSIEWYERRRSTGSHDLLADQLNCRKEHMKAANGIEDDFTIRVPLKKSMGFTTELKEELVYLRTSLKQIYAILTNPNLGRNKKGADIEFNKKFAKHFKMMQMILTMARMKRAREEKSLPLLSSTEIGHREPLKKNDKSLGWTIDQWLGRIINELGVDRLQLNSRAEECAMSFEAICNLKETKYMLTNQVQCLEELIKLIRNKKETVVAQMEEFKKKIVDVGQKVGNVVVKVLGLRDRLGSLANSLTEVQHPWVNRLVSDVQLATKNSSVLPTGWEHNSPVVEQLESLSSVVDNMVSLLRKSEVVIRNGIVAVTKKESILKELEDERKSEGIDCNSYQSYGGVPNSYQKRTFLE